jgi:outer membrane protein
MLGFATGSARRPSAHNEESVHRRHSLLLATWISLGLAGLLSSASAQTVTQALASAYSSNPEINSARAQTRSDDENVPIARAGNRPTISGFSSLTASRTDTPGISGRRGSGEGSIGVEFSQNVFSGFRVRNSIRQSQAGVLGSRELLRNTVQNVLFDAAQAYMDVVRDTQLLDIRRRNVTFLGEQVRAAGERFEVGETTRTDVAQTRARLASARADISLAEANLAISRATFRQIIGRDPTRLIAGFPFGRLIPARLEQALTVGQNGHPVILSAIHQADAQAFAVRQIEGELLPTVSIEGSVQHFEDFNSDVDPNTATISGRVSVPIYQGGAVSARVRQAKEQYGLRKIEIDLARDQVRAAVVSAWAQAEAARGAIAAAGEGIEAAEIALSGVQEEQQVGQRTTLDVLDQQQELLNARELLVLAQRDQVVAFFSVLSAMGRLTAEQLRLPTPAYDPVEHYQAVNGKWAGVRTRDGR